MRIGVKAEYDSAKVVMLHRPDKEMGFLKYGTKEFLFQKDVNINKLYQEFADLEYILKKNNITVYTLKDLLREHKGLKDYVKKRSSLEINEYEKQFEYALLNPKCSYEGIISFSPLINLIFIRDLFITTDHNIILMNPKNSIRKQEIPLIKMGFEALGINYIQPKYYAWDSIEGGDFIPYNNVAFFGVSQRTTLQTITWLLSHYYDSLLI